MTAPNTQNQENLGQNQNQNQNLENQTPPENLETPTPNTPPVNTDTVSKEEYNRTLDNTHSLYRQTLVEAETKRKELERQLEEARRNVPQQQQVPDDQLTPAQLIQREVSASVKPLLDEFSQFRQQQQQNTYQNIKNTFKSYPQFAQFWNALEPYLDQEMQGKPITVENVQTSLATVIGRIQMQAALNPQQNLNTNQNPQMNNNPQQQNFNQPQNQNQNPNPQQQNNLPPHLRPSAPPLPNRNGNQNLTPGGNQLRPLTELEKRVAREQRPPLTDAQYIDWISETPENVVNSQIGIPPRQS